MTDVQLYRDLLGLKAPWSVEAVKLDLKTKEVRVMVACDRAQVWACPHCQQRAHIQDWEARTWRHLDSCQFRTVVAGKVPRVRCVNPDCTQRGSHTVQVPWAEGSGRFTVAFETFALRLLQECSLSAAAELLECTWDQVDGIMDRAVQRGLARKAAAPTAPTHLCVDEKSAGKGQDYVTIVASVPPAESGGPAVVEFVGDGREQTSLDPYWQQLGSERIAGLQGVCMDFWRPFWNSAVAYIPHAAEILGHDRFHVMGYVTEALNEVRKSEHAAFQRQGDDCLKGTRIILLRSQETLTPEAQARVAAVYSRRCLTGRAYAMKEAVRDFWSCSDATEGEAYLRWWTGWAQRCRLKPMQKVGAMLKRHKIGLLTWFRTGMSNGPIEGLNNKIQGLVKRAFGFRNRERFKNAILFHCGGLDLAPAGE